MDKKTALKILVAHGCCEFSDYRLCKKFPWNKTDDYINTNFSDVIEEAVDVILEEVKC